MIKEIDGRKEEVKLQIENPIGLIFRNFVITKKLGEGAYGCVYRARIKTSIKFKESSIERNPSKNCNAVAKFIKLKSKEKLKEIWKEANAMISLESHLNIV